MAKELKDMQEIYNQIIQNMKVFLQKIGVSSDVVGINVIVKYMINGGYLTNNAVLTDNVSYFSKIALMEEEYISLSETGVLVPYGCSACRHIANFMYAIYGSLGYQSSQLFVYAPDINIKNNPPKGMNNKQIAKVLESLLNELDFDVEYGFETIITREGIEFSIECSGTGQNLLDDSNHTINIVVDRAKKLHIFDSTSNSVGTKSDKSDIIKMYLDDNFYIPQYIKDHFNFDYDATYFEFANALSFLKHYPTAEIEEDFRKIREYEQECFGRISDFKQFKAQNSKYYDEISGGVQKLVRKLNEDSNYV